MLVHLRPSGEEEPAEASQKGHAPRWQENQERAAPQHRRGKCVRNDAQLRSQNCFHVCGEGNGESVSTDPQKLTDCSCDHKILLSNPI